MTEIGTLTEEQALSKLGKFGCSDEGSMAFLAVDLSSMNLLDLTGIGLRFTRLQEIDVSDNRLSSLDELVHLSFLRVLKASRNELESTDSIARHQYLENIDLSHNMISDIGDWSSCLYLKVLDCSYNRIEDLSKFVSSSLMHFDCSHNSLTSLQGLEQLSEIEYLDVSYNELVSLATIDWNGFAYLSELIVNHNKLTNLSDLFCPALLSLDLSNNLIAETSACCTLNDLICLKNLKLLGCPVCTLPYYRLQIIYAVPRVATLDNIQIDSEEILQAKNIFGDFLKAREEIWKFVLPNVLCEDVRVVRSDDLLTDANRIVT